jgi:hypothetical protein
VEAQKEWGGRLYAAKCKADLAAANRLKGLDTQLALTALGEVRREVMSKLESWVPAKGERGRIKELEERVHENELEILDWKRSLKMVRMWCKFREGSVQVRAATIVQELVRHVDELHREKLESAEAHDLYSRFAAPCLLLLVLLSTCGLSLTVHLHGSLSHRCCATQLEEHLCRVLEDQLEATQADLEAASAELMRTGNSLQHALRSKQVLMSWKLKAQPEVVGLRQKVQALKATQGQMEVRCACDPVQTRL